MSSTSVGSGGTCWRMSRWRRVCVVTVSLSFSLSLYLSLCVSVSPDPEPPLPRHCEQRSEGSYVRRGGGGLMKCEIKLARRALTAAGWLLHPSPTCMPLLLPLPIDVYMAPPPSSFGYRSLLLRPTRTRFKLIIM